MLLIPVFKYFGGSMGGGGWPVFFMVWPLIAMFSIFTNLFGLDHRAFRTLMLLPVPRHRVLLAYHLALLFIAGGIILFGTVFAGWYFAFNVRTNAVMLMQAIQVFLLMTIAGSYFSIYGPSTVARNVTQGARPGALISLLMPFVFVLIMLPSTLCVLLDGFLSKWLPAVFPVGLALSALFLAITLAGYPMVLRHAGDLLHVREQRILDALIRTAK